MNSGPIMVPAHKAEALKRRFDEGTKALMQKDNPKKVFQLTPADLHTEANELRKGMATNASMLHRFADAWQAQIDVMQITNDESQEILGDKTACINNLSAALKAVLNDLHMRASEDSNGFKVLGIGRGVLLKAEKALGIEE